MRGLPSTILLVVVAAALVGYIYFVDAPSTGDEAREKVFTVDAQAISEITVTSAGETTVLGKVDDAWRLTSPVEADADESEVSSLTSQLSGLEITRIVDENATDLAEYGLADPRVAVGFAAGDVRGRLLLGDVTPTTSDMYAMREGETAVFLIPAFLESTFARSAFDLRDKRVLRVTRGDVERVEIVEGAQTIRFARAGEAWRLEQPYAARGDFSTIDGLVTRLASTPMTSVVAEQVGALAPYGLDRPAFTVRLGAGSTTAELVLGREEDGRVYARDQSRAMVFTVEPSLAGDLGRTAEEYRNKDLFDFRTFNARRAVVTRGDERIEFEKRAGEGENAEEAWHRVGGPETHTSLIEDFLAKLAGLRAESFAGTSAGTGLGAPILTVEVTFDEDRTERVSFGRSANEVFGARADEPGAARLDPTAFTEASNALEAATTPATDTEARPPSGQP
ncbi:MAG: DUF4340 domain-containing protein [Vicinamibacteria bacterium]